MAERSGKEAAQRRRTAQRLRALRRERAALRGRLQQAQALVPHAVQLQALGLLVGGIGHDLNNVLQTVASGAALIARLAQDPVQVERAADKVGESARRGAAITARLAAVARRDDGARAVVLPQVLLQEVAEVLAHLLGAGIACRVEADAPVPVRVPRRALEAVLVGLAANARDAMPRGGTLTLGARVERVGTGHAAGLAPGGYVCLTLCDTGTGMPPEVLARACEPFFTTKSAGHAGLGLTLADALVRHCGGALALDSRPGEGTQVSLWLPQAVALPQP